MSKIIMAGGPRRAAAAARRCRSGRRADISAPPAASGCRAIRGDSGCADLREDIFHSTDRRDSDFWPAKNRGDSGRAPAKSRPARRCARARGSPRGPPATASARARRSPAPRARTTAATGRRARRSARARGRRAFRRRAVSCRASNPTPRRAAAACSARAGRAAAGRGAASVGRERGGRAPESAASKDLGSEGCGVTKGGPGSSKKWRRMPTGRASGVTAFNGDSAATPRLTGGSASSLDWRGVLSDGSRAGGLPSDLASGCRRRVWPRGSRSRGLSRGRRRSIAGLPRPAGGVEGRRCRGCASAHSGKVTMLLGAGGRPKGCN